MILSMGKYANDRVERLVASNITPEHTLMSRKTISVAENGRRYSVDIVNGAESVAYPIDGVAISDGNKCDKFVAALRRDDGIAVFVELKGKDITHAIEQLESTIRHKLFMPSPKPDDMTRARIVTLNSGPASASKARFVEAQNRFKRLYNIDLQIRKGTQKDNPITF